MLLVAQAALAAAGACRRYTLDIRVNHPHSGAEEPSKAQLEDTMSHGDINMDGKTDTADLGVLLGNFGWISPPPE